MNRWFTALALFLFAAGTILAQSSFTTGQIAVNLSNYGRVRILNSDNATQQIDRSSLLVGKSATEVFDYQADAGIAESSKTVTPTISNFELYNRIDNSYSGLGPNVSAKINVYGWNNQGYVIVKINVTNREAAAFSAYLGMEIIPKIDNVYGNEAVQWNAAKKMVYTYKTGGSYVGYKILSTPITVTRFIDWYEGYEIDSSYYSWWNPGRIDTFITTGPDGAVGFFGQNKVNLGANENTTMYVGISLGANEAAMVANMTAAEAKYATLTDVAENNSPYQYALQQNYPNPFNPATSFKYSLEKAGPVTLTVYNALGKEVARVVDGVQEAGSHTVSFDASRLSSGIYYYRLASGSFSATKKMTLLK